MLHDIRFRLKAVLRKEQLDSELQEELRFHLEHEAEKNRAAGMPPVEALRRAKLLLGGVEQTQEACRDSRGTRFLEDLLQDSRYAVRGIWKDKVFSALILLVLSLGIGVNTAVFSVVNEQIIKPLPFRDSSRLLAVWDTYLPQFSKVGVSPAELRLWQTQSRLFQETAWYRYVPFEGSVSTHGRDPIAVHTAFTSSNLFPMLGVAPLAGRMFSATEDPWSVLISEHLSRRLFADGKQALGQSVRFNEQQLTIIGVIPDAGQFPDWADLWLPNGPLLADQLTNPVRHALGFLARLRGGVTKKQASARLLELSMQLAREHPKTSTGWGIRVSSLQNDLTENIRPALVLLLCAGSFLLLVGCANIASLLLARASARVKEIALRLAIGATGLRIIRQLLTESILLSVLGGVGGLLVAKLALLVAFPAGSYFDTTVLLFTIIISMASGIVFGLAPATQLFHTNTQALMKSGSMTDSGVVTRSALVIVEIALTMMLVVGAGIVAKSFLKLMNTDPGFNPKGLLTLRISAPPSQKPELLFHRLEQKLQSLPTVTKLAASNTLPLIADRANTSRFHVPGSPLINPDALPAAQIRAANPDYFSTLQISMKAGRAFTERDLGQPVVIINQTMAQRFWPGRDPVGIRFVSGPWGPNPAWVTIVGVVANVKQFGLDSNPTFDIYFPSLGGQFLIVRTSGSPSVLAQTIERTIHTSEAGLAVSDIRSMEQIARESALKRRWTMGLLVVFALLALALALIGIFGVISWSVVKRSREIGIRMALGAQQNQMLELFIRHGLKLTSIGLAFGILASFTLRDTLANLVYGVSTADPAIYVIVSALMLVAALLASYIPARKATRVDPLISLRYE